MKTPPPTKIRHTTIRTPTTVILKTSNMAQTFSNTSTKHADSFKEANLDRDVSLAQKIGDLSEFITNCKFGMMTTRDANKSGNLVSRCMALVAKASFPHPLGD